MKKIHINYKICLKELNFSKFQILEITLNKHNFDTFTIGQFKKKSILYLKFKSWSRS